MDPLKLRCSSLPLAFACPGSQRPAEGELLIRIANEGADLGTAVHEILAALVGGANNDGPDVRAVALKYGVDADDLGRLVGYGLHAWRALAQYYPDPQTEVEFQYNAPPFTLSGHLDLLAIGDDWANLADWKSGYKQPDHFHQVMGYALLCFANHPHIATVRATTVWLRDWSQETLVVTAEDISRWEDSLINRVVHWDGTYSAGAHCQFCPRFATCPARQALVQSAVTELSMPLPPPEKAMAAIVTMYREGKLSVVKGLLEQIDAMIYDYLKAVGPIDLGNGRELALVGENRDTIDPLKAWPVLSAHLTNEELAPCLKVGKTILLDTIGDKAPKEQKAKAKAGLMEELKAANAVTTTEIHKRRERKIEPKEVSNASA